MKPFFTYGVSLLGLSAVPALGEVFTLWGESGGGFEKRITSNMSPNPAVVPRQTCTHGPTSRNCWLPGFDINTNYYASTPNTGVTRTVGVLVIGIMTFADICLLV